MARVYLLAACMLLASCKQRDPVSATQSADEKRRAVDTRSSNGKHRDGTVVTLQQQLANEKARMSQQTEEGSMSFVISKCEVTGYFAQESHAFELGHCAVGYDAAPEKYLALVSLAADGDAAAGPIRYEVVANKAVITLAQQLANERASLSQQTAEGSMSVLVDEATCQVTGILAQEANLFQLGSCLFGYAATAPHKYRATVRKWSDGDRGMGPLVYQVDEEGSIVTLAAMITNERARVAQKATGEQSMQFSDPTGCRRAGVFSQGAHAFELGTCLIEFSDTENRYLVTLRERQDHDPPAEVGPLVYDVVRLGQAD